MSTRIFGLSELPVGTIADAVQINSNGQVPPPAVVPAQRQIYKSQDLPADMYQSSKKSNLIIKMRNGFGKLMSHFSKAKPKAKVKIK